jgi:hypothetical protein
VTKADRARHHRQRPLAARLEQAFRFEPCLQAQELFEQRALPGALQAFDDQLQVAPRLIDAQPSPYLDQFAIARYKVEQAGGPAEHRATDLAGVILDRKIAVPAGGT